MNDKLSLFNITAEEVIIGTLLEDPNAIDEIDFIHDFYFYSQLNVVIFQQILKWYNKGLAITNLILEQFFHNHPQFPEITDWSSHFNQLRSRATSKRALIQQSQLIQDLYLRRQIIETLNGIKDDCHNLTDIFTHSAYGIIEKTEEQLFKIAHNKKDSSFISFEAGVTEAIKKIQYNKANANGLSGIPTGFIDLDKKLGGLNPTDLIIIAARPSMGKTAFATNIAYNVAKSIHSDTKKSSVLLFSLEMSGESIFNRLLSQVTKINSDRLRRGSISDGQLQHFIETTTAIKNIPFFIDDTPSILLSSLASKARRIKRKHGLDVIIIDYLQLITTLSKSENRTQELGEITQGLKAIAKELSVPVIALSQLSRTVEQREDKRPLLSDLRESGSIEQDADIVMFLYREEYYLQRSKPNEDDSKKFDDWKNKMTKVSNIADVIIGKNRNGPVGEVQLHFDAEFTQFSDLLTTHA